MNLLSKMTEVATAGARLQVRGVSRSPLFQAAFAAALFLGCANKEAGPGEPPQAPASPVAAQWDGIYQGPYHIYLRIETKGDRAVGTWRALGARDGEVNGNITGDTHTVDLTEHPSDGSWSGRGAFVYGKANGRTELHGRFGLGARSTGGNWYALKRPDLPMDTKVSTLLDAGSDDTSDQRANCTDGCDEVEIGEE
jgi:hypothetical protein